MGAALAASIVVSNVIGVGIFMTPGLLALDLGDPRLLLGIWVAGGMMALTPEMGPVPPNWLPYFGVADADATVAKAILAGGKVLVPPTNIPGGGRFAVLHDPQGATFGIHAQTA